MSFEPRIRVPHRQYGPAPWYAWLGDPTPQRIDRDLQRFMTMGVYAIIVIPLYGMVPEYLGAEYFDRWRHLCRRCRQWGMTVWIYDDVNWPSGTAAGLVLRDFPETRQHVISFTMPDDGVADDPTWRIAPFEGLNLSAYGSPWSLCTTGYLDALNPKAVDHFIDITHEAYRREVGEFFGDVIVGFFTDEPVAIREGGVSFPYTNDLFEQFAGRYGYDLRDHMTALVHQDRDKAKVRRDYWTLVIDMLRDNCYRRIAHWCQRHGLMLTGHLLYEEILSGNIQRNGDMYDMLSTMQVPGIDLLSGSTSFDDRGAFAAFGGETCLDVTGKLVESATFFAHRQRSLCEAFGCTPHSGTAMTYKRGADFLLHHGISIINDNLFTDTAGSFRRVCGCHSFWTPWVQHYRHFSEHMATLSFLNAGSRLLTNLAVYYPGMDLKVRFGDPDTIFTWGRDRSTMNPAWMATQNTIYAICHGLIRRQWDYYLLFDQVIRRAEVSDAALCDSDFACRVLVFPDIHYLGHDVAAQVATFLDAGGAVICVGRIPRIVSADGTPGGDAFPRGDRVIVIDAAEDPAESVARALDDLMPENRVRIEGDGSQDVMLTHRVAGGGLEHVFLTNFGERDAVLTTTLDDQWAAIDTVSRTAIAADPSRMTLAAGESRLFVRHDTAETSSLCRCVSDDASSTLTLEPAWRISPHQVNRLVLPVQVGTMSAENADDLPTSADETHWHDPCTETAPVPIDPDRAYWLRGRFDAEILPEALTVDGVDCCTVYINGQHPQERIPTVIWDDDNITWDISGLVRPGRNDVLIHYVPDPGRKHFLKIPAFASTMARDLPPFVLSGSFAVTDSDTVPHLTPLPESVHVGSIYEQGLPCFTGALDIEQTVTLDVVDEHAVLDLGNQHDTFEVRINGTAAGVLLWPPYRLRVGHLLRAGTNVITLRLLTANAPVLKRYYMAMQDAPPAVGLLDRPRLIVGT